MMKRILLTALLANLLSLQYSAGSTGPGDAVPEKKDSPTDRFKNGSTIKLGYSKMGKLRTALSYLSNRSTDVLPKNYKRGRFLRELPRFSPVSTTQDIDTLPFKPSVQVGSIVHMFASTQQAGFMGSSGTEGDKDWQHGFSLYRARILVGGQLSKKGSFFLETEIPSIIGTRINEDFKNVKVSQIVLDAQYEHKFAEAFQLIAGLQLVSHNRNGLQGAAALMANDFTYFQYPYNLFANSPLQGNFGRDLGVNARGFLLKDKLEYRLGLFSGRRFDNNAPWRTVGRVVYNFLDQEKDFYYAGTKLGQGKTIALAGGFDTQATYSNIGADLFIDVPLGGPGSLTVNSAFTYMTGGTNPNSAYSFAGLIPAQTIQFLEVGYYLRNIKVQPWIRYENQAIAASAEQTGGMATGVFNDVRSATVFGGGLNYFFSGLNTNARLSYTTYTNGYMNGTSTATSTMGQVWMQLQFFVF